MEVDVRYENAMGKSNYELAEIAIHAAIEIDNHIRGRHQKLFDGRVDELAVRLRMNVYEHEGRRRIHFSQPLIEAISADSPKMFTDITDYALELRLLANEMSSWRSLSTDRLEVLRGACNNLSRSFGNHRESFRRDLQPRL